MKSAPVISIVGLSGSGKTTFLVELVKELSSKGLRIGTIKHSCHPHPMDMPGKDSWRHKQAGAERTIFIGPETMQMVTDLKEPETPMSLYKKYLSDMDLVIIEGFVQTEMQKIEVVRRERSEKPICTKEDGLIALVSDIASEELGGTGGVGGTGGTGVPIFDINAASEVANFIMERLSVARG